MSIPTGPNADKWFEYGGDNNLRINYNLNADSVVIDGGAYHGDWFSKIYSKYACNIIAYEPTASGYNICNQKVNDKIKLHKSGLYDKNAKIRISSEDDGSSIFNNGGSESIDLVDTGVELASWGQTIDLFKLNVEGAEYEILEKIIQMNAQTKFKNFQIQFHRGKYLPNAEHRRDAIRSVLSKTHHLTYDFTFVWENWEINQ